VDKAVSSQLYVPTREACEFALNVLEDSIDCFIRWRDVDRHKGVCIVVLADNGTPEGELIFQGMTLRLAVVPQSQWAYPFMDIAIGKARASLQHRDTTANLIKKDPELVPEFCRYAGGVYGEVNGLTVRFSVGVSGVAAIYDEIFAWWITDVLHGIAQEPREVS
jgi:hypothetical protein